MIRRAGRYQGKAHFDFETAFRGVTLRLAGYVTAYHPATGPSMSHAGGDPEEGGEIEDLEIVLIHKRKDGTIRKRDIEDADGKLAADLEDAIFQHMEEADDR